MHLHLAPGLWEAFKGCEGAGSLFRSSPIYSYFNPAKEQNELDELDEGANREKARLGNLGKILRHTPRRMARRSTPRAKTGCATCR